MSDDDLIGGLERFRCEILACVLTRSGCADRYVRADALRDTDQKGWEPAHLVRYISCRKCPIGRVHAGLLETRGVQGKRPPFRDRFKRSVVLPVVQDPPKGDVGEVRFDTTKIGVFVRVWTEDGVATAGPFRTKKVAKRWASRRMTRMK